MYTLSSDHHRCHLSGSLSAKTLWWMLQMAESRQDQGGRHQIDVKLFIVT